MPHGPALLVHPFDTYVALGDSISIDVYPAADAHRRFPGKASTDALGAASLLYKNDDSFWPEFRGRDLHTALPALRFEDLTSDGATTQSLLRQVDRVAKSEQSTLATITAGGNDLLGEIGYRGSGNPVLAIEERLRNGIDRLLELRPNAIVLVGTVYDPSDGTNRLPGYQRALDREAEMLSEYNEFVRKLTTSDSRLRLADIHQHFLGHGLTAPEDARWYLRESIIEPSARGASEVRRLWLERLER